MRCPSFWRITYIIIVICMYVYIYILCIYVYMCICILYRCVAHLSGVLHIVLYVIYIYIPIMYIYIYIYIHTHTHTHTYIHTYIHRCVAHLSRLRRPRRTVQISGEDKPVGFGTRGVEARTGTLFCPPPPCHSALLPYQHFGGDVGHLRV